MTRPGRSGERRGLHHLPPGPIGAITIVVLLLPETEGTRERAGIEREAADASLRIHQQAIETFGQLLDAARSSDEKDPS